MTSNLSALTVAQRPAGLSSLFNADVLGTTATRALIIAFGMVSSILTSRLLQPSGRGEYFWVVTVAQLAVQFSNLGLQSSNTFLVARDRAHLSSLLGNSLMLSIALGGVIAVLAAAGLRTFSPGAPLSVWVIVALTPAMLLHLFTSNLLVGIGEVAWYNRVQLVSNLAVLTAMLGAGLLGVRAGGFLVAVTFAWSATGIWAASVVARRGGVGWPAWGFDREIFVTGVRYAAKAYVATLCGFLVLRSNVFVLQSFSGYQQVGYFSVAAQLSDVLAIFPQSVALVLFPSLVSAPVGAWSRTARQAVVVGIALGIACIIAAAAAPIFIPLLFGAAFAPSVNVLRWLLPAAFFTGMTSVISQYAAAAGFPRRLVVIWVVGLIVGVISSYVLIPRFGGTGAAISLSLTQGLILLLIVALCLHIEHRRPAAVPTGL